MNGARPLPGPGSATDGLVVDVTRRLDHFTLHAALTCPAGSLTAVVGPSGSGKTTLVRILAGLDRPDAGRVLLDGEPWFDKDAGVFVPPQRRGLGYVFQEYSLLPHLSVWKNAVFGHADAELAEELLSRLGIAHLRDVRPARISGGERQRAALVQALARRPRALLLDEPFSSLDPLTRHGLHEVLAGLRAELGIPMILVTHDIAEALRLGDRVHPLHQGRHAPRWLEEAAAVSGIALPPLGPCGRPRGTGPGAARSAPSHGNAPGPFTMVSKLPILAAKR